MAISNSLIPAGSVDILTVTNPKSYVTGILFCNYGDSDEIITVYARVGGAAAGNVNTILKTLTLPAKNTFQFDFKLLLVTTDIVTITGVMGGLANATITYL